MIVSRQGKLFSAGNPFPRARLQSYHVEGPRVAFMWLLPVGDLQKSWPGWLPGPGVASAGRLG